MTIRIVVKTNDNTVEMTWEIKPEDLLDNHEIRETVEEVADAVETLIREKRG